MQWLQFKYIGQTGDTVRYVNFKYFKYYIRHNYYDLFSFSLYFLITSASFPVLWISFASSWNLRERLKMVWSCFLGNCLNGCLKVSSLGDGFQLAAYQQSFFYSVHCWFGQSSLPHNHYILLLGKVSTNGLTSNNGVVYIAACRAQSNDGQTNDGRPVKVPRDTG